MLKILFTVTCVMLLGSTPSIAEDMQTKTITPLIGTQRETKNSVTLRSEDITLLDNLIPLSRFYCKQADNRGRSMYCKVTAWLTGWVRVTDLHDPVSKNTTIRNSNIYLQAIEQSMGQWQLGQNRVPLNQNWIVYQLLNLRTGKFQRLPTRDGLLTHVGTYISGWVRSDDIEPRARTRANVSRGINSYSALVPQQPFQQNEQPASERGRTSAAKEGFTARQYDAPAQADAQPPEQNSPTVPAGLHVYFSGGFQCNPPLQACVDEALRAFKNFGLANSSQNGPADPTRTDPAIPDVSTPGPDGPPAFHTVDTTTEIVSDNPDPSNDGVPFDVVVKVTATNGDVPTGEVSIAIEGLDHGIALPVLLKDGEASFRWDSGEPGVGKWNIKAFYYPGDDAQFKESSSKAEEHTVKARDETEAPKSSAP